jgi:transglutaminase-like putative cysteine protease/tetratricopeptide (TPR) repeat protein
VAKTTPFIQRSACVLGLIVAWQTFVSAGARGDAYEDRFKAQHAALLAQRSGPEAVAPLAALVRMDGMLRPGRLAEVLRELVDAKGTDPLVAAQAGYLLSLEEDRAGQYEQADSRRRGLGLIRAMWVLGPFDGQGRSGLARAFPPEAVLPDLGAWYAGKSHKIGWDQIPAEVVPQGALVLGGRLRPDNDAVAYLLARVHSDRGRWIALRLGSPGPVKVWINGELAMVRDVVRTAGLDQDAAAIWLPAGNSALLVKTVITTGAWNMFLRLTDPNGAPLKGVTADADATEMGSMRGLAPPFGPPAATPSPAPVPAKAPVVRDLVGILRQRAEAAKTDAAERWLDLARALDLLRSEDRESKAAETAADKAADAAQASPAVRFAALIFLGQVAREEDDARHALERALELAPGPGERALVLSELGGLAQRQHRQETALRRWQAAAAADPVAIPPQLALAGEEREIGLVAAALRRLDGLTPEAKRSPEVIEARTRTLEALGRFAEAEAERRGLWKLRQSDVDLLRDRAVAARRRGDPIQAAGFYEQAARWRPDFHFLFVEQARMLEGAGRPLDAQAVLRKALKGLPDEPRLHEEMGRLLARNGQRSDALANLRQSLLLRPQQPALRRYAEALAATPKGPNHADASEDLARAYAVDGEALGRSALLTPVAAADDDPAVILLDHHVTRVHPNGLADRFVQRLIHVRTDRAARDNQETLVRYTPGEQEVEIREARIFRRLAAGEVEVSQASGRDDRDLSEPWYGLYYDTRAEVVTFENLRAGDVIEVQYTVADVAYQNDMADYFGEFVLIADILPKRSWDYTLIAPKQRSFFFNQPKLAGMKQKVERQGNDVITSFSAASVSRVDMEPAMPGFTEVAPYLHVSTYQNWQDVGRWYWSLVADQMQSDQNLKRQAAEVTTGLQGDAEKVRALHRFVIEKTRYVGLEFGIHGYKPYPVSQVLLRRFGDCKDKALLLVALLREVGIESELVLLRSRRAGMVDSVPASLAIFDHAITYVPRLDIYLDGTAEFSGMSELPSQDQGVMVLRVGPKGPTLARTPVLPASANRADRVWKVALAANGSAWIDEIVTVLGQAAQEWRSHYQTPGERYERYAKVWNGRNAGARLQRVNMAGIEDRNQPVVVRARAFAPRLAQPHERDEFHLSASSRETDLTQTYARLGVRKWPLVFGFPWQHQEVLEYRLPDGFRLLRTPTNRKLTCAFGRFEIEVAVSADGRTITLRSLLSVERDQISASEYGEFRAFLREVDSLLGQPVVMAKGIGQ